MRRGDRAALWVVALLATWWCFAANVLVWEGLPLIRHVLGLHMEQINYQLSVWPVLVDLCILMVSVVWTKQQIHHANRQGRILDGMTAILQALDIQIKTGEKRETENDRTLDEVLALVRSIAAADRKCGGCGRC